MLFLRIIEFASESGETLVIHQKQTSFVGNKTFIR